MNKPVVGLLVLSLAANVALVAGAFRTSIQDGAAPAARAMASEPTGPASALAAVGPEAATSGPRGAKAWAGFVSSDPAVVRDALRAAGVPEVYVRAVVWDRLHRAREGDAQAIALGRGERRYWQPIDRSADAATRAASRALDQEIREEFNRYFDEPRGVVADARRAREQFAFLPGEKAAEVVRVSRDYAELTNQVRQDTYAGVTLDEDQRKLTLLEEERRADLMRILTPEEFELYELHTSRTANLMRTRLTWFEPTEQEFREIHALQSAYDREFGAGNFGAASREAMQARSAAQRELAAQIERTLGPERYADYQRATNFGFQAAMKIVNHFELPRENAVAVHGLEQEYQRRTREAMKQAGGDRQKAAALAQAMAAEASQRVVALLGEEGAKAFRDTGGSWLRNLEQQAQRAAAPAAPAP